jgi:ATP-dependent DNA helicase DinG
MKKVEVPTPTIEVYRGIALKKRGQQRECDDHPVDYPFSKQAKIKFMQAAFPAFEEREGQISMMDLIYESFQTRHHAIIEAGTGIGKSLGYLLPAVYFAKQSKQPVVISTYTLQLQEQLLKAEIPKLKRIIQIPFQAVLLKGRSNYLSLAKFKRILVEKDNNYETALAKMQILVWLIETETGDKDELHLSSGGELFWERLQSNENTRYGLEKPWVEFDFYEQAKAVAAKADLIITNHAFLLSDLLSTNRLIPESGYLILDEAHHLERAATRKLGRKLDYLSVRMLMNRIGTSDQKQLLYRLETILAHHQLVEFQSVATINETINDFMYEYDQLFSHLGAQANHMVKTRGPKKIPIKLKDDKHWKHTVILTERLVGHLQGLVLAIQIRVDAVMQSPETLSKNSLGYLNDLELAMQEMNSIKEALTEFFIKQKDETVYWLEYTKKVPQQGITLLSHPVSGKDLIWETFFSRQKSVVMTSATLSVKHSFQFFIEQLGMENVTANTAHYPSPFQYDKQVKVLVPEESPNIKDVTIEEYSIYTADYVITAALAAKGRMMILFTSHEQLRAVYQIVKDSELLPDFTLFGQGISGGSKMRLLKNFQVFEKALLFGTTSFWEGVDIPGEDLSCLMIVRLPFSPPDEPVTAAKCHLLEMKGKNPFWTYSLPEAILRFRQGFGRLIRTTTDKGVLIVLDRRILTTSYGKEFQLAIPPVPWQEVSQTQLTEVIESWI